MLDKVREVAPCAPPPLQHLVCLRSSAVATSKLASKRSRKTLTFTLVQDLSWESRAGQSRISRGRSEYVNRSHPSTL